MDGAPTLSEITGIQGNAAIAGGTAGEGGDAPSTAPVQFDQGLQFLNEASQARAKYNEYLQNQYQNNLSNNLTNLRSIDFSKALPADLPALRQKYADLATAYSNNFDAVRNPASNPQQWDKLNEQEADLRGDIQQSAAHNVIANTNKKFLAENPSWNTPVNQGLVTNFSNAPMDQRKDFLLQAPNEVDLSSVAKVANSVAIKTTSQQALSKGGNWINTTEAKNVDQQKFDEAGMATLKNTFSHGVSLYDQAYNNYKIMPDAYKTGADGKVLPFDQYITGALGALRDQGQSSNSMQANPFKMQQNTEAFEQAQQERSQAFQADQEEKNRALQIQFQKKGTIDPAAAGEAALKTMAVATSTGNIPTLTGQSLLADNSLISRTVMKPDATNPDDDKLATKSTVKMPAQTYLYSKRDSDGNFRVFLRDNQTGKLVEKETTYPELLNNLSSQYGANFAPQIAGAISSFSQNKFGKPIPTEDDLQKYYQLAPAQLNQATGLSQNPNGAGTEGANTPVVKPATIQQPNTPPVVNTQADYDALPKGSKYTAPNGTIYTKN